MERLLERSIERVTVTANEAAEVLGCTPANVRHLCRTGKLEATEVPTRYGLSWRIPKIQVMRYAALEIKNGWKRGRKRRKAKRR